MTASSNPNTIETLEEQLNAAFKICIDHAKDLVTGARALLTTDLPHLAYHLAVLAMEEVGRAHMLVMSNLPSGQSQSSEKLMDLQEDHIKKLLYALWLPFFGKEKMTKETFKNHQSYAETIHRIRLLGLYISPKLELVSPPRSKISKDEAERMIALAEARIGIDETTTFRQPSAEQAANAKWFTEVVENPEYTPLIFGAKALEKLHELEGDAGKWIDWLKTHIDASTRESQEILAKEMSRTEPSAQEKTLPKWKVKVRLESASHSIRQKVLKEWNNRIKPVQLFTTEKKTRDKKGELIVEFQLPMQVSVERLWQVGLEWTVSFIAAINIATRGLFWWYVPKYTERYYESMLDLENDAQLAISRQPALRIGWGDLSITFDDLARTVLVFRVLTKQNNSRWAKALQHYNVGLALMAKSDIYLQFEPNAFMEFWSALKAAMISAGDWNGQGSFSDAFGLFLINLKPENTSNWHKDVIQIGENVQSGNASPKAITLTEVGEMKIIFDIYLWNKVAGEIEQLKKEVADSPETQPVDTAEPGR